MIKSLRFSNFKGFESLEVPEIAPITIIGGKNNVGKSSLLEGIHLFYDTNNPGMFMRHLSWRGINVTSVDPDTIIAPIFYDFDLRKTMKIEIEDAEYHATMEVGLDTDPAPAPVRVNLAEPPSPLSPLKTNINLPPTYTFKVSYEVAGQEPRIRHLLVERDFANIDLRFDPPTMKPLPKQMRQSALYIGPHVKIERDDIVRYADIDVDKRSADVINFLRIIEPQLTELSSISGLEHKPTIYADIGMRRKVPIGFTGDAINRLFLVIVAIATAKHGVVLIDEIDDGIHYSCLTPIWEYLSRITHKYDCQIIATTHNYECLQRAVQGVARADRVADFRYVRIDKYDRQKKGPAAKTYDYDLLETAVNDRWEVR